MEENIPQILLAGLISLLLLYVVIRLAVYAGNDVKYRNEQLKRQGDILEAMARKDGIEFTESE